MAGRYSRTYTRKKSVAHPPISQFDRLINEDAKGTHPVASKTAGHVGKWGITSFTSLRSINESYSKEDSLKRNWIDAPISSNVDSLAESTPTHNASVPAPVKRRKFFKSRDVAPAAVQPSSPSSTLDDFQIESQSSTNLGGHEEMCNVESFAQVNSSSSTHTEDLFNESHHGPISSVNPLSSRGGGIKLKIFKSKNSDINSLETYSSCVQLPSDDSGSLSNSSSVPNSPICDTPLVQSEIKNVNSPNSITTSPNPYSEKCGDSELVSKKFVHKAKVERKSPSTNYDLKASLCKVDNCQSSNNETIDSVKMCRPVARDPGKSSPSRDQKNLQSINCNVLNNEPVLTCKSEKKEECTFEERLESNNELDKIEKVTETSQCRTTLENKLESNTELNKVESDILSEKSTLEERLESCNDNLTESEDIESGETTLFSSGFDENVIVDRTSIEYPSSQDSFSFSDGPISRSNTIDLGTTEISLSTKISKFRTKQNSYTTKKSFSQDDSTDGKSSSLNKKKSIFKSRQKDGDSKKRATYKHKWHGHEEKEDSFKKAALEQLSEKCEKLPDNSFEFDDSPALKRVSTWPVDSRGPDMFEEEQAITSLKCPRKAKKYYTVIKNVKKTHQLQESGEFQEFNDDVDYFLDALRSSNSESTRCLAALNLAQKCMTPAFRMHLRAHATITKFFKALSDAPTHPQLAECAAMVMFTLSQDHLNMDLDSSSLELMLNLLDADSTLSDGTSAALDAVAADHSAKIEALCKELQIKGHAKHLNLNNITAATLAMESLLSLTSKRAGEWFKEELRELGGVNRLIGTVIANDTVFLPGMQMWTSALLDKLSKIERCLKVLENVTHQNASNQEYLLTMDDGKFAKTLMRLFRMLHDEVSLNPINPQDGLALINHNTTASKGIITTLITVIKVLINLTHGSSKEALGSKTLGSSNDIYDIVIYCLLVMPTYLDHDTKFEVQVLACSLLLNLVENSHENRRRLMNLGAPTATDDTDDIFEKEQKRETSMCALVELFYSSEESARVQEAHTDQIIDKDLAAENVKEEDKKDEDIEDTVARLLKKAGRHMEDTLIAAYTALLAGYCLMDNKEFENRIRDLQPEKNFKTMVTVLKKFLHFMNLTATTSLLRSLKPTERVVKYMEQLDRTPEEEAEEQRKKDEAAQAMAFEAFGF